MGFSIGFILLNFSVSKSSLFIKPALVDIHYIPFLIFEIYLGAPFEIDNVGAYIDKIP